MIWVQTLVPLAIALVTVLGGGGLIKVLYIDKAIARTQEQLQAAQAGKTATEGEVAVRAEDRAWVVEAREEVKAAREEAKAARDEARTAREDAKAAEESARQAQTEAHQARIDRDNLRDQLQDLALVNARLTGRVEELHSRVTAINYCRGGVPCPMRTLASTELPGPPVRIVDSSPADAA